MPIIRQADAPATTPTLTGITYTVDSKKRDVLAMSPDRATLYFVSRETWNTTERVLTKASSATATPTTVATFDQQINGMWWTNDGEVIISTRDGAAAGYLYKSTGWASGDTTATWRRVLTLGGTSGPWPNVHGGWGLTMSPKGHHREGLIAVAEYGGQSTDGTTPVTGGSVRLWVSLDYGATWAEKFNLIEVFGNRNMHMHGVAFDPWMDILLFSYGDGYAGGTARSGIRFTRNPWDAKADIVWEDIVGPWASATFQVTNMLATEAGILALSDGAPDGMHIIPRQPYGAGYDWPRNITAQEQLSTIGATCRRWAPGMPILISQGYMTDYERKTRLHATMDGRTIYTVYVDSAAPTTTTAGVWSFVGPDRDGRVHWTQHNDGRGEFVACSGELIWTT